MQNTFNGNSLLTGTNSALGSWLAADGFVYFQAEGNVFVARNFITNNALEGVQLEAGPNSVVGNTFYTFANDGSCCALNACQPGVGWAGFTVTDCSTCFIGNSVYGGRHGESPQGWNPAADILYSINFSGNTLTLYPPFDVTDDDPGAAVLVADCLSANVFGNTLVSGGYGFEFQGICSNALVLNNNFGAASYRGIGYRYVGDSLNSAQIFGDTLGEGVSFHLQIPYANSFGWFAGQNAYLTGTNQTATSPFTDPPASALHISP
jgi:hypothetical protein